MNRILALLSVVYASLFIVPLQASAITMDTVLVGDMGNANDPTDGDILSDGVQNFGAVPYAYRIGKFEVTIGQYTAFLNAVAATDTYALFHQSPEISRSGFPGSYSYSASISASYPVDGVSWGDAARFSNWLHNGQPTGVQNASTTEAGAYSLNGAITEVALGAVSRNSGAKWFIPSENEWYKAAFYEPATQGGDADNYWAYPTRSNSTPNSDQPPGIASIQSNVTNFYRDDSLANGYNDGFAATGSTATGDGLFKLTNVGAYSQSGSFYGTFDQSGNLWEWNEAFQSPGFRGIRGGSWASREDNLRSSLRAIASGANHNYGFRVASVPNPSGLLGDYNQNGIVDTADYTLWRDGLGTTYTQADYTVWKSHFGNQAGSGAGGAASAPEPSSVALVAVGVAACCITIRRRSSLPSCATFISPSA